VQIEQQLKVGFVNKHNSWLVDAEADSLYIMYYESQGDWGKNTPLPE